MIAHQITLNPSRFAVDPLIAVLSTLVHEMVHQLQREHGRPGRKGYHNEEFAKMMEQVGLRTYGKNGARVGQHMSHRIIPDGPFAQACVQLIREHAFKLDWFDRRVGRVFNEPIWEEEGKADTTPAIGALTDEDAGSVSDYLGALHDAAVKGRGGLAGSELTAGEETVLFSPLAIKGGEASLDIEGAIAKKKKPNPAGTGRRKYLCGECGAHVLGKPGLAVLCLGCDSVMVDEFCKEDLEACLIANGLCDTATIYAPDIDAALRQGGGRDALQRVLASRGMCLNTAIPESQA